MRTFRKGHLSTRTDLAPLRGLTRIARDESAHLAFSAAAVLVLLVSALSGVAMTSIVESEVEGRREQVVQDVAALVQTELNEQARSFARLGLVWSMQTMEGEPIESTQALPVLTRDNAPDLGVAAALTNILMDTYVQSMFPRSVNGITIGVANVTIAMSVADVLVEDVTLDTKGIDWASDLEKVQAVEELALDLIQERADALQEFVTAQCDDIYDAAVDTDADGIPDEFPETGGVFWIDPHEMEHPGSGRRALETAYRQCRTYQEVAEAAEANALHAAKFDARAVIAEVPGFDGPGVIAPRPGKNFYRVYGEADVVVREDFGPHATSLEGRIDTLVFDQTPFVLAKSQSFETIASGEESEVSRIATYILTALAQWRVLNGAGMKLPALNVAERGASADATPVDLAVAAIRATGRNWGFNVNDLAAVAQRQGRLDAVLTNEDVQFATKLALDLAAARHFRALPDDLSPEVAAVFEQYRDTALLDVADVVLLMRERGGDITPGELVVDMRLYLAQALYLLVDQAVLASVGIQACQAAGDSAMSSAAANEHRVVRYWDGFLGCMRTTDTCAGLGQEERERCQGWRAMMRTAAQTQLTMMRCLYLPWVPHDWGEQPVAQAVQGTTCANALGLSASPRYNEASGRERNLAEWVHHRPDHVKGALMQAWAYGGSCEEMNLRKSDFGTLEDWDSHIVFCPVPDERGALEWTRLHHKFGGDIPLLLGGAIQWNTFPAATLSAPPVTVCVAEGGTTARHKVVPKTNFAPSEWPALQLRGPAAWLEARESRHNDLTEGDTGSLWRIRHSGYRETTTHYYDAWWHEHEEPYWWGGDDGALFLNRIEREGEPATWSRLDEGFEVASSTEAGIGRTVATLLTNLAYGGHIYQLPGQEGQQPWLIRVTVDPRDGQSALDELQREATQFVRDLRQHHVGTSADIDDILRDPRVIAWMSREKEIEAYSKWLDETWHTFAQGSADWESTQSILDHSAIQIPTAPLEQALSGSRLQLDLEPAADGAPCDVTADDLDAALAQVRAQRRGQLAQAVHDHLRANLQNAAKASDLQEWKQWLHSESFGYFRSLRGFDSHGNTWSPASGSAPQEADVDQMLLGPIYAALANILADALSEESLFDHVLLNVEQMLDGSQKMMDVRNIEYRVPLAIDKPFIFTSRLNRTGEQDYGAPPVTGSPPTGEEHDPHEVLQAMGRTEEEVLRDAQTLWERVERNEKANATTHWRMLYEYPQAFVTQPYYSATQIDDMYSPLDDAHVHYVPKPWRQSGEELVVDAPGYQPHSTMRLISPLDEDWQARRAVWYETGPGRDATEHTAECAEGFDTSVHAVEDAATLGWQERNTNIDLAYAYGLPLVAVELTVCETAQTIECTDMGDPPCADALDAGGVCGREALAVAWTCTTPGERVRTKHVLIEPVSCVARAPGSTQEMTIRGRSLSELRRPGGGSAEDYCDELADWNERDEARVASVQAHQARLQEVRRDEFSRRAMDPKHQDVRAFEEWAVREDIEGSRCDSSPYSTLQCSRDLVRGSFRLFDRSVAYPWPTPSIVGMQDLYAMHENDRAALEIEGREGVTPVELEIEHIYDGGPQHLHVAAEAPRGVRYADNDFSPTPYQTVFGFNVDGLTGYRITTTSQDLVHAGKPLVRVNETEVKIELKLRITVVSGWALSGVSYADLSGEDFWGADLNEKMAEDPGKAEEAKREAKRLTTAIAEVFAPIFDFLDLIGQLINSASEVVGEIIGAIAEIFRAVFRIILEAIIFVVSAIVEGILHVLCSILAFFGLTDDLSLSLDLFGLSITLTIYMPNCRYGYYGHSSGDFGFDPEGDPVPAYPLIKVDIAVSGSTYEVELLKYKEGQRPVSAFLAGVHGDPEAATVPMTLRAEGNIRTPNEQHPWRFGFDVGAVGPSDGMHAYLNERDSDRADGVHQAQGNAEPVHNMDRMGASRNVQGKGAATGLWLYHRFDDMPDGRFVEIRATAVTDHGADVRVGRELNLPAGFKLGFYFNADDEQALRDAQEEMKPVLGVITALEDGLSQMFYDMLICLDYAAYDETVADTEWETSSSDCVPTPDQIGERVASIFEEAYESVDESSLAALAHFDEFGLSVSFEMPRDPPKQKPFSFMKALKARSSLNQVNLMKQDVQKAVRQGEGGKIEVDLTDMKSAAGKQAMVAKKHAQKALENAERALTSAESLFAQARTAYESDTADVDKKKAFQDARATVEAARATKKSALASFNAADKTLTRATNPVLNPLGGGSSSSSSSSGSSGAEVGVKRGIRVDVKLERPQTSLPVFIAWASEDLPQIFSQMTKGSVSGGFDRIASVEDLVVNVYAYQTMPASDAQGPHSLGLNLMTNLPSLLQRKDATQIYSLGVKMPFINKEGPDIGPLTSILDPDTIRDFWWLRLDAAVVYIPPNIDKLLEQYAPHLVMHAGEVLPVDAEDYLARMNGVRGTGSVAEGLAELAGRSSEPPTPAADRGYAGLTALGGAASWIDGGAAEWPRVGASEGADATPTVYARFAKSAHFFHLQYYMLWPTADAERDAEGIWSVYTVLLRRNAEDEPTTAPVTWAAFSRHRETTPVGSAAAGLSFQIRGERWAWGDVLNAQLLVDGTHARVQVAKGSHALSFKPEDLTWGAGIVDDVPGSDGAVQTQTSIVRPTTRADADPGPTQYRLVRLVDDLVSLGDDSGWLRYEGRWGDVPSPLDADRAAGSRGPAFLDHGLAWDHPQVWALSLPRGGP